MSAIGTLRPSSPVRRPPRALPGIATLAAIVLALLPLSARAQQEPRPPRAEERRPPRPGVAEGERPTWLLHPRPWLLRPSGYLGVDLLDLTPELRLHFGVDESAGVMVASVADDSPAAAAGLEVGDIITAVDGEAAVDRLHLARQIGRRDKGQQVMIDIYRAGGREVLHATVDERSRPQLWLNTFDGDGNFTMEWQAEDDPVLMLPAPGGPLVEIEGDRVEQVMGHLHERLASPEFTARMLEFNSNTEELERRIKELEERLLELSKQLEALED
jgi:hypothetical protein